MAWSSLCQRYRCVSTPPHPKYHTDNDNRISSNRPNRIPRRIPPPQRTLNLDDKTRLKLPLGPLHSNANDCLVLRVTPLFSVLGSLRRPNRTPNLRGYEISARSKNPTLRPPKSRHQHQRVGGEGEWSGGYMACRDVFKKLFVEVYAAVSSVPSRGP